MIGRNLRARLAMAAVIAAVISAGCGVAEEQSGSGQSPADGDHDQGGSTVTEPREVSVGGSEGARLGRGGTTGWSWSRALPMTRRAGSRRRSA